MFEIKYSVLDDVEKLSADMRVKDRLEAEAIGMDAKKALYLTFKYGILRKSAFLDGKIVAMWGICGTPLSLVGRPYLITSNEVSQMSPLKFARIYGKEVKAMSNLFPVLENYVDAKYDEAVRLLKIVGFELTPQKINGNDFYRYRMVN